MRFAMLFAATVCLGLAAQADGVSRKTVTSPDMEKLTATDLPAAPGHERYRYRHGATYKAEAGSTATNCEAVCAADAACQAWSFIEAYGASGARCELKSGGGKPEENLLATSGISPRVDAVYWGEAAVPAPIETLAGDTAPEVTGN